VADEAPAPEAEVAEETPKVHTGKPAMSVKVYAPFQVYFEGEAYSVSAVNATGPFDILPKHHNFLCMLVPSEVVIRAVEKDVVKTIKVHRALMQVTADHVVIFMDV
jgi:F0F1-type ATP synthase epsilon subunit